MPYKQSVFFLIDTQGANCVGCYRPDLKLQTPNIDRLAAEGLRCDRAYTCAPVCGPARSAILTGVYPHSNGVLANDMAPHLDFPTLGQRLQAKGILAGYVGKWHLDGTDYFGSGHCPPGWDEETWMDGRNYLASLPDEKSRLLSRQAQSPEGVAKNHITSGFTHAHRIADRAINFIQRHKNRDFLLIVSIDEPHHPWICPEPYASAFEDFLFPVPNALDSLEKKPRSQREWAAHTQPLWRQHMLERDGQCYMKHPRHFACNSYSDEQVGRVLAEANAALIKPLIIYTSDHGDMFGSHGLQGKGPCMYEEIVRVPLLIKWEGQIEPGRELPQPVSQIDFAPTFLDFLGLTPPDILQGRSLLPLLRKAGSESAASPVFIEFNRFEIDHDGFGAFAPIRCICEGDYKLIINLLDEDELYNLRVDPGELQNLILDPQSVEIRSALLGRLLAWMNETRDPMRGPHWGRRLWSDAGRSTWGGPTRPRRADADWAPGSLLYDTASPVERYVYEKY